MTGRPQPCCPCRGSCRRLREPARGIRNRGLPCESSPSPRRPIPAGGNAVQSGISASLVLLGAIGSCFAKLSATALPFSVVVFAFRDATGTDHFHVVIHQGAGARGVANLDQVGELRM